MESNAVRHNKKSMLCTVLLKGFHKSLLLLVINKIFLKQNLCVSPYDHDAFYTKLTTELVKGVEEVGNAIIHIIYTQTNLSSVAYSAAENTCTI